MPSQSTGRFQEFKFINPTASIPGETPARLSCREPFRSEIRAYQPIGATSGISREQLFYYGKKLIPETIQKIKRHFFGNEFDIYFCGQKYWRKVISLTNLAHNVPVD